MMDSQRQESDWVNRAAQMREDLAAWYRAHPGATLDEIVAWVTPRRRELMGQLVEEVVASKREEEARVKCPQCGEMIGRRASQERQVIHFEGDSTLRRSLYYCPRCKRGFSPPG